ncbi:excitatory amino acid transporter 3-like isoform X2 [Dreissena polymorpha]|uniref:excitatory amino acid transporter 3-like isoform X2 n=1 Tax=Dreissena polymorpha TaxID=45954 RepID=UPI0022645668|nr:excitatory amino acid transporter 3-like isoform X2 [Dreissena polymorpha]
MSVTVSCGWNAYKGRIGLRAVVYYLTTTFAAVIEGIILVLTIKPGNRGGGITPSGQSKDQAPLEALFDLIRNCFPDNLIEASFRRLTTVTVPFKYNVTIDVPFNATGNEENATTAQETRTSDFPSVKVDDGMNILGIVVFSIFLGAVLSSMGRQGKPLLDFFETLHIATMKLTMLVIWYSPVGIIFLVATKLIEMEDPNKVFVQLAYYMLTVLVGLAAHGIIVLPLVYFVFTRKNPVTFMYGMTKALLTAWGTASSSATLPVTMECLEGNHVDVRIAKFVAPIGATVNMDGTALYEAVAAIFIAQVNGISLNIGQVITVSLTATAAAIGAAGIPSAGLVTMTIVLTAVGLPTEDISIILAIDWFLDRFRTAINVLGDAIGAGIVDHLSQADLKEMDRLEGIEEGIQDNDVSVTTESSGTSSKENGVKFEEKKAIDIGLNNPAFTNGDLNTPL